MTTGGRQHALLITPAFFGYERDIAAELTRQGFQTTFLDERPSNSAFARALMRVRKDLIGRRITKYYRRKAEELVGLDFALVVVIKAEVVPRWFLEQLRARYPDARFVFYTFDALDNAGNCLGLLDCFDELLSFDRADVAKRPEFNYLPLFYTPDYHPLGSAEERRWEMSFVGTLHSERYQFVKHLFGESSRSYQFFYVQARWYFAIVKYLTREHASVPWSEVSFTSLSRKEIAGVFRNSRGVLDMQRAGQTGLTMRTFEVLASGSILLTTNEAIKQEPFYDPRRIIVVPAQSTDAEAAEVRKKLERLEPPIGPPEGFQSYSIEAWAANIAAVSPP